MAEACTPLDFASMSDEGLADFWLTVGLDVPEALVQETLRRGSRTIPHLGPMIAEARWWETWAEDEGPAGWAPVHALMLLCAIGGPEATPYAAALLRHGQGGDWLMEMGPSLVLALGPASIEAIAEVAADGHADAFGRWSAADGLMMLGLTHEGIRPQVIAKLRPVASGLLRKAWAEFTEDDATVLTAIGHALARLHDDNSRELIARAFAERRWETTISRRDDVEQDFRDPFHKTLEGYRRDPLQHFSQAELARLKESTEESGEEALDQSLPEEIAEDTVDGLPGNDAPDDPVIVPVRIGRNEPCPCGSGQKFKKCCG